jgi:hypothetical protein
MISFAFALSCISRSEFFFPELRTTSARWSSEPQNDEGNCKSQEKMRAGRAREGGTQRERQLDKLQTARLQRELRQLRGDVHKTDESHPCREDGGLFWGFYQIRFASSWTNKKSMFTHFSSKKAVDSMWTIWKFFPLFTSRRPSGSEKEKKPDAG